MDRKSCDECRRAYTITRWDMADERELKLAGPPCASCRPDPLPANTLACEVYRRCAGQLILSGMGGVVDIDIQAVKLVMDLKRIPARCQDELMEKVQYMAGIIIGERARAAEERRDKNRR